MHVFAAAVTQSGLRIVFRSGEGPIYRPASQGNMGVERVRRAPGRWWIYAQAESLVWNCMRKRFFSTRCDSFKGIGDETILCDMVCPYTQQGERARDRTGRFSINSESLA